MNEKVIEVENLQKSFKKVHAVNDLSFAVKKGELFAFLGENGAGKSTTINMITGILTPDSGLIKILGEPVNQESKKKVGVVFQFSGLDKVISAYDNLYYRGLCYGLSKKQLHERILELAEQLHFQDYLKRPLQKLSGGQKRKIDIARALLHDPEIIILDEPTTGLDPQTRKLIWQFLNRLRKERGLTVFLTTHYMEEASEADYVVILDEGKKLVSGTPSELKDNYAEDYIKIYRNATNEAAVQKMVAQYSLSMREERDFIVIPISSTKEATKLWQAYPDVFEDFEVFKGDMDDVFLKVTGKRIGE